MIDRRALTVALIGKGAIADYVAHELDKHEEVRILAVVCRPGSCEEAKIFAAGRFDVVTSIDEMEASPDLLVDCAGHHGLHEHGPAALKAGIDVISVSTGAIADATLALQLQDAADEGSAKLTFLSGAVGGIDVLSAGSVGDLRNVTYTGRKPPKGWSGSRAEEVCDLDSLTEAFTHFSGTAREAALAYPKNANVAATIALAGLGLDRTSVNLIADPAASANTHEMEAEGEFGKVYVRVEGQPLPNNPRSSALAAMSVVRELLARKELIGL